MYNLQHPRFSAQLARAVRVNGTALSGSTWTNFLPSLSTTIMFGKVSDTLLWFISYVAYCQSLDLRMVVTIPSSGRQTIWPDQPKNESSESTGFKTVRSSSYRYAKFITLEPVFRCCACPQTKSVRDDCFLHYDPSEAEGKCSKELQNHIACMRSLGFKV